ncbi:hypothetical protein BCV70DRAFT_202849 [Testicularia cyperi]|uniref:Uncharacterized protein n=1 Tax=Testicularia cyperi TaxID=1882483 RepID=A0A317XGC4_9BASI|nr:hypothetical protein BCV70DRAFT_202849 [Testicularia cyperi]
MSVLASFHCPTSVLTWAAFDDATGTDTASDRMDASGHSLQPWQTSPQNWQINSVPSAAPSLLVRYSPQHKTSSVACFACRSIKQKTKLFCLPRIYEWKCKNGQLFPLNPHLRPSDQNHTDGGGAAAPRPGKKPSRRTWSKHRRCLHL